MIPFYKDDQLTTLNKVKKSVLLSNRELKQSFLHIDFETLSDMFDLYDIQVKWRMFHLLDAPRQKNIIEHMPYDDLVDFIKAMKEEKQNILSMLEPSKRVRIEKLLTYSETFAGSLMSYNYILCKELDTAGETLRKVIHDTHEDIYIDDIFIENDMHELIGRISLSTLVTARKNTLLKSHMQPILMRIHPESDLVKTIDFMMDYDKESVPVINQEGQMIGLITADDVLEEMVETFDEDFKGLAQIQNIETFDSGFRRYLKRMPWLIIALIFNIGIALLLGIFEQTLLSVAALILFQPLISGMSGNIATQALAVTLLSDETLFKSQAKKEIWIGVINGFLISVATFIVSTLFLIVLKYTFLYAIRLSVQVSISLWIAMIIASSIGVCIPWILRKLKKDVALASGPLITTINDLIALTIYFSIATIFI